MSNSILPAAGNLDIVNANVRADKFNAATNIGVANTNPDFNFSVGDKFHVDKDSTDPVSITGNVVASGIKISNLTIGPAFDFASVSNVGNVTANVIQFANATTGFTTTANVEIGGNISLTANAQVKVGSNVLAEYTGPHGREPKEVPLKKYPEILFEDGKFDANETTNTYTQAGYTVTASSVHSDPYQPWKVFDDNISNNTGWLPNFTITDHNYSGSEFSYSPTGTSSLTTNTSDVINGEWLQIKLPSKIQLSSIVLHARSGNSTQIPEDFKVLGSNTGIDGSWVVLASFVDESGAVNSGTKYDINALSYYNHYALITTQVVGDGGTNYGLSIAEWKLYGYEEPAPPGDLSLDTTIKSTFNSVRSNNYVMYFDGEDPTGDPVVPKYLPSGTVKTITPNNITFDASNNCWSLDGSTESNVTTADLGFEGDVPHTVSMWVNSSNLDANATTQQLFSIGSGYDKALVRVDDTQIAANTWHNVTYAYQGEGGSKVTYVDGRKVEEEKVEDTFGDYPPFAMTDYETGGYRASASTEYTSAGPYNAWEAFDGITGGASYWSTFSGTYTTSNPPTLSYTGTTFATNVEGVSKYGEWLQIEFPHKVKYSYSTILAPFDHEERLPRDGYIVGSNDLSGAWTTLHRFEDMTRSGVNDTVTYTPSSAPTQFFKYFRLVIEAISTGGANFAGVDTWNIYGHKEGDLTRFPEPTRVLKYPNIVTKNGTGEGVISGTNFTSYAQRGHIIKASSWIGSYPPYAAFNGQTHIATGTVWVGGYNQYGTSHNNGTGGYGGSRNLKTDLGTGGSATSNGEWLYIEMPHKIKVTSTKIVSYDTSPSTGHPPENVIIYGTNDPSSSGGWNVVDNTYASSSSGIPNNTTGKSWAVSTASSPTAYKYFALVIVKVNNSGTLCHALVSDWQLIGTQEDTGTSAIVGGPFAGKVANFRVYDKYLGEERIQEIYDAQKDAFGHKKSSMTFYKGRIGVGTTEPEGALTVVDEPHALAKFPMRAVSADDLYVEGEGETVIRAVEGSGYQAFDGLTSTSWTATPDRRTRLSEEVDFGAWLKLQTPESMSLKKAEFESNADWRQVGSEILTTNASEHFGRAVACSHDGTRIIAGGFHYNSRQGLARVYDWNGTAWEKTTNTLIGTASEDRFGIYVAMSGDGSTIAVAARTEHVGGVADVGTVRVYYLNGSTWIVLPDSGPFTEIETGAVDAFVGQTSGANLGGGGIHLSYDGRTLLITEPGSDSAGTNRGETRIFTYADGAWSQKGSSINGTVDSEELGSGSDMSEDGNHIVIGTKGDAANPKVKVYEWNGTNAWQQKGSDLTYSGSDEFGPVVSISNDGNTVAVGIARADIADGALVDNGGLVHVYHWTGSAWGTPHKLTYNEAVDEYFGSLVVLSGDGKRLLVGAPGEATFAGEILTYAYTGDSWKLRKAGVEGFADTGNYQYTGYGSGVQESDSVALSRDGSTIVTGALGYDNGNLSDSGRVRVFSMPSNIKSIWGSNDDTNWTKITTAPTREEATSNVAGLAFGYDDRLEFKNLDNPNYYKYHAIVADAFTRLKDVKLFGVRKQGSSTLHDGQLTLTKNLDVPRIGPALDADNTPRRDRLILEYNTSTNPIEDGLVRDTSGRGFNGNLVSGAYYNASEKALAFDGTDDYITVTASGVKGSSFNKSYSLSMWARMTNENSASVFFTIGSSANGKMIGFRMQNGTTGYLVYHYGGDYITTPYTYGNIQQWRHVVATWDNSHQRIYIDGVLAMTGTASSSFLDMEDDPVINLGFRPGASTSERFKGYQSNPKIYDCTLTAEEVKTLYDMGRCDEGHHVVNFSKTRVGIGLGDGEAPRGALDVRGDAFFNGLLSTGLPAIFGRVNNQNLVQQSTVDQNITDVLYTQGQNMKRTAGGLLLPVAGMYIIQLRTHCWFSGGAYAVRDEHQFTRYNSSGTVYNKQNRGTIFDIAMGSSGGNSDMHHASTVFIHANAGDYVILSHTTSPTTTRNYNNEWNYISAACVCLDEPQFSSQ